MRKHHCLALVAASVVAGHAQAQSAAHFAPLEFLVGHCWTGTMRNAGLTDTHCFEWMYDKRYVRDRHVVSSSPPYEGETIYAWDPESRQVVFRYLSNQGLFLNGHMEQRGDSLVLPSSYMDGKGQKVEVRSVWTRTEDGYHAQGFTLVKGKWESDLDVLYRQQK